MYPHLVHQSSIAEIKPFNTRITKTLRIMFTIQDTVLRLKNLIRCNLDHFHTIPRGRILTV
ncbi:hypothetical protein HanIR_Chr17g0849621 [Helianthus annuus]|nr:hypothetical protein HanIR_Chr17g0849621 [Helianthus annuus]